jgi:hypothetical protein
MKAADVSSHFVQDLDAFLPAEIGSLENDKTGIPRIARDPKLTGLIRSSLRDIPTHHAVYCHDSRSLDFLPDESLHLVVTSPQCWTLKEYRDTHGPTAEYVRGDSC